MTVKWKKTVKNKSDNKVPGFYFVVNTVVSQLPAVQYFINRKIRVEAKIFEIMSPCKPSS